ncbi:MAG: DUF952 domain-containing protein [Anaerolineales bacterium]|jgi:uncharacterized protein (DUF952 family)
MAFIVHICLSDEWQTAQKTGVYRTTSLDVEGFIHCSRPDQVVDVANRYYGNRTDLLLLWIDPSCLAAELRWEASDESIYPHVYGPINIDCINSVSKFLPDEDGIFRSSSLL